MPYSDNLYSAEDDDSDNESFSDQLSPTDGYFNRVDIPPNVMVPDPSLEHDNTIHAKAHEAREDSDSNSHSRSPSSHIHTSAPSNPSPVVSPRTQPVSTPISPHQSYNEIYFPPNPLLAGPPPAYSPPSQPSTTLRSSQEPPSNINYNTFSQDRLEEGHLPPFQPQSMGTPPSQPSEETPLWSRREKTWQRRAFFQRLIFVALMVSIFVAIPAAIFDSASFRMPSNGPSRDSPTDTGKEPERVTPPWLHDVDSGSYCSSATVKGGEGTFVWPMDQNLKIRQEFSDDNIGSREHVSAYGEVRIRPIPKGETELPDSGYISVVWYTSDPSIRVIQIFDDDEHRLLIKTPRYTDVARHGLNMHCVSVEVTAWIPEGAIFDAIEVRTIQLTQRIFDGLNLQTHGSSVFRAVSGGVHFPDTPKTRLWMHGFTAEDHSEVTGISLQQEKTEFSTDSSTDADLLNFHYSSRHIEVQTTSGTISGIYPLYDYLGIESVSGSVHVAVTPQDASKEKPVPAQLEIKTTSGTVRTQYPIDGPDSRVPFREYITAVKTTSGTISGSFITGSKGQWHSESGGIRFDVLPIIDTDLDVAEFHTYSTSGSTLISLLDPIFLGSSGDSEGPRAEPEAPWRPIGEKDPYSEIIPPHLRVDIESTATAPKLHNLESSHTTVSGSIQLQYPPQWEGMINAKSTSGSIRVEGKDVEIVKYTSHGWVKKEVVARKPKGSDGERFSSVQIGTTSGSISFKV